MDFYWVYFYSGTRLLEPISVSPEHTSLLFYARFLEPPNFSNQFQFPMDTLLCYFTPDFSNLLISRTNFRSPWRFLLYLNAEVSATSVWAFWGANASFLPEFFHAHTSVISILTLIASAFRCFSSALSNSFLNFSASPLSLSSLKLQTHQTHQ